MGDISPNFSRREFACKDRCGFNTPSPKLIEALEELRQLVGVPLAISSGCRCRKHNASVKGSPKSQHLNGTAVDIIVPEGFTSDSFAVAAEGVKAFASGGIGKYKNKNIVHVDVRSNGPSRWVL